MDVTLLALKPYSIVTVDSLDMDLSTEPLRHQRTGTSENKHAKERKLKEY